MIKKFSYILFCIVFFFDRLVGKRILIWFSYFIEKSSYTNIEILKKKTTFFTPNTVTALRVKTFFTKEPETLEWIDSFKKKKLIFWDIGANIGLYSIYNAIKNSDSETIAFEPSTSNLRVLSRNISINSLENKVKIFPLPLTNKDNLFSLMNENKFIEGGALNTFGEKIDFEGKAFKPEMKYALFGTNINFLLRNKILKIPDYIKIDVDGIEHLIIEGGNKYLSNKKIKSCLIEVNENFKTQYQSVLKQMKNLGFKEFNKKHNFLNQLSKSDKFGKTFNYIFEKK